MKPSTRPLRIGIIGCGRIARVHLRYVRQVPGIEIAGLCDREFEHARELQHQSGVAEVFREVSDLLRVPLDAVHVLTPPATHAEVATAALESGVHVLVEKPMATTAAAAERMATAARNAGRILCVDHNRLFDPPVVRAREMVAAGAIGTLLSVEAYQGVNVQEGGPAAAPLAMWLNLAPHPLYLLRTFIGDVTDWHVCGGPLGELRAVLKGTKALGSLFFSPGTMPYLNGLTLHGTTGTVYLDLNTMTVVRRRERRLPKMLSKAALNVDHALQLIGGTARTTLGVATGRIGTYPGIGVVIGRFYDAIRTAAEPPVTVSDGQAVVTLLDAIWAQAQHKNSKPVRRRWAAGWLPSRGESTVLVTGASGLLGRRVVDTLHARGHRVRALVHAAPPQSAWDEADNIEIVSGSLGDNDSIARALEGIQVVVHCAARVARRGTRAEFFHDNVNGTAHLLDAAQAAGIERFIHVSSIGIYGTGSPSEPMREDSGYDEHPELRGAYTWSKLEADRLVQEAGRAGRLRTVVLRPGILVGQEGRVFTARLPMGRALGRPLIVGHRSALLPLSHVDDVASGIAAAVGAADARGAYNLVDQEVRQDDWLNGLRPPQVRKGPIYIPPFLLRAMAAGMETAFRLMKRPPPTLSRYKIRRATESLRYDTRRARRDLGWRPEIGVRSLLTGGPAPSGGSAPSTAVPLAQAPTRRGLS
jgi:predicted dehydrogenase/nucleoside-diphosphate-sugar epimerase